MYLDLLSTEILFPTSSIFRSRRSFVQICFQNDARPFLAPFVVVVVVVGLSHVHFLDSREFKNFGFLPIAHIQYVNILGRRLMHLMNVMVGINQP